MGQFVDRSDFIDMLEESAVTHRPVSIALRHGEHFVDDVSDVVTAGGEDYALFREHGQISVSEISDCCRAEPYSYTYNPKIHHHP